MMDALNDDFYFIDNKKHKKHKKFIDELMGIIHTLDFSFNPKGNIQTHYIKCVSNINSMVLKIYLNNKDILKDYDLDYKSSYPFTVNFKLIFKDGYEYKTVIDIK